MARKHYQPPVQGKLGMMVDSILIMALVFVSLSAPLWFEDLLSDANTEAVAEAATETVVPPTWESLGQNTVMQAQWEKLGMDAAAAAEIINARFDYTIDPLRLLLTVALIVGYFAFMLRASEKEYREVLAEKFDNR